MDLKAQAVIHKEFEKEVAGFTPAHDPSATISLTSYAPNRLVYESSSETVQLAVFSEIYYPKGWTVTIDGKEASHMRANFVLRSMLIPAGHHEIVFSFRPDSYYTGNKIAIAGSWILFLLLAGTLFMSMRSYLKKD